jgi:DNA-binding Lrp family transcriptional regulator
MTMADPFPRHQRVYLAVYTPAMPVKAYVLIQTDVNSSDVAPQIRSVKGIDSADDVSGPYDVIARVVADDLDQLGRLVVSEIQRIEGVTRTLTCPIVEL